MVPDRPVTITVNNDELLEPVEEGFRLLLVVDESQSKRSLVSFGRQLALFRIDDQQDSKSNRLLCKCTASVQSFIIFFKFSFQALHLVS